MSLGEVVPLFLIVVFYAFAVCHPSDKASSIPTCGVEKSPEIIAASTSSSSLLLILPPTLVRPDKNYSKGLEMEAQSESRTAVICLVFLSSNILFIAIIHQSVGC